MRKYYIYSSMTQSGFLFTNIQLFIYFNCKERIPKLKFLEGVYTHRNMFEALEMCN